jgi:N-acetylneuraminic acid mutarotase
VKRGSALLFVFVFLVPSCLIAAKPVFSSIIVTEDTWTSKTPMPQTESGTVAAAVNGKIYVMSNSSNYEYDPAKDNWAAKKSMPTPRRPFGIATYQNRIYVIGGSTGGLKKRELFILMQMRSMTP